MGGGRDMGGGGGFPCRVNHPFKFFRVESTQIFRAESTQIFRAESTIPSNFFRAESTSFRIEF